MPRPRLQRAATSPHCGTEFSLVLDSVTSKPQWIRQPKPRDVVHDVCVFVCKCVLGSPDISGYAFSSTFAFSLRLMPFRLAVGASPQLKTGLQLGLHDVHLT